MVHSGVASNVSRNLVNLLLKIEVNNIHKQPRMVMGRKFSGLLAGIFRDMLSNIMCNVQIFSTNRTL